jgi:nucleoside-diphosphate-sugar epimerase
MGVDQFIYFSSSMVYGDFNLGKDVLTISRGIAGITEDTICRPKGIYGALKLSGEMIVKAYNGVFDIPYTIIRPSAVYGERDVGRRVVQIFIENVKYGKDLTINGDGEEKLDFTYIKDFVQGFMLMIGNEKAYNETFNLTHGKSRSIKEMAEFILEEPNRHCLEGNKLRIIYKERDKLMPIRGTLSVDKARSILGYAPSYSIEKGVKQYMEWYYDLDKYYYR